MSEADDALAHYGVKGMKWGVRKKYTTSTVTSKTPSGDTLGKVAVRSQTTKKKPKQVEVTERPGKKLTAKGGQGARSSTDAKRAMASRQKVKKSSTDALSNKELQDLVTRMQLEQNYARLYKNDPRSTRGEKFAKWIMSPAGRKQAREGYDAASKIGEQVASEMAKKKRNSAARSAAGAVVKTTLALA